jgi:UDP-N-acetyl-D-mannosaminuronate dehydrogenase
VDPGNPTFQTHNVPKVVGGFSPTCSQLAAELYGTAIQTIVPVSSTRVAEMVKLLENTFRAVNIGLVNELALMCDRMNINVWEVVDAAKTKPFGFMPSTRAPASAATASRSIPFYLSWKAKQTGFDPALHRAGRPHQRRHAALRRRQGRRGAQLAPQGGQRLEASGRRRRLQARHRRHARVARRWT